MQVEQYTAAEYAATAQVLQTEEVAGKLDADLLAMRQRLVQVRGTKHLGIR